MNLPPEDPNLQTEVPDQWKMAFAELNQLYDFIINLMLQLWWYCTY